MEAARRASVDSMSKAVEMARELNPLDVPNKLKAALDENIDAALEAAMEWESQNPVKIGVDDEVKHAFSDAELKRMEKGDPPWESMSFACGGWLMFYMFGVAKAIQAQGLDKNVTYCGC